MTVWQLVAPRRVERYPIAGSLCYSMTYEQTVFGDEAGLFTSDEGSIALGGDSYGAIPFGTKYIWQGGCVNATSDPAIKDLWLAYGFDVSTRETLMPRPGLYPSSSLFPGEEVIQ